MGEYNISYLVTASTVPGRELPPILTTTLCGAQTIICEGWLIHPVETQILLGQLEEATRTFPPAISIRQPATLKTFLVWLRLIRTTSLPRKKTTTSFARTYLPAKKMTARKEAATTKRRK
jgi:hypothetical protein